jgi:hypothetical protein
MNWFLWTLLISMSVLGIIGIVLTIIAIAKNEVYDDPDFYKMMRQRNLDYYNNPVVEYMKRNKHTLEDHTRSNRDL